jgi:hypothetical protein
MQLRILIDCDSDAFDPVDGDKAVSTGTAFECARILRELANELEAFTPVAEKIVCIRDTDQNEACVAWFDRG